VKEGELLNKKIRRARTTTTELKPLGGGRRGNSIPRHSNGSWGGGKGKSDLCRQGVLERDFTGSVGLNEARERKNTGGKWDRGSIPGGGT